VYLIEAALSHDFNAHVQPLKLTDAGLIYTHLASFPGCRRNGLGTSTSSNYYLHCLNVDSTNFRTLSYDNSKTQLHHTLNHHSHAIARSC